MNMMELDNPTQTPKVTVDDLLRNRRVQVKKATPTTAGFWSQFDRSFAQKMMGALARPRRHEKALTVFSWVSPAVFIAAMVAAVAVAYLFSPERAIARWEKQTSSRDYVVDKIDTPSTTHSYSVDHGMTDYTFTSAPTAGSSSLEFSPSGSASSKF